MKPEAKFDLGPNWIEEALIVPFNVFIAYDGPAAARRALRLYEGLARAFSGVLEFRRDLCRFDLLGLPSLRQSALEDAVKANMVIIAAFADSALPVPVKVWLDLWASKVAAGHATLVALLESRQAGPIPPPARKFLEATAEKAGLDFFAHEIRTTISDHDITPDEIHSRAEQTSSVLSGILEQRQSRPASRWGINE